MLAFCLSIMQEMSAAEVDVFTEIHTTYQALMEKIICKYLDQFQDQEDAMQDALLAIARNIRKLKDPKSNSVKLYVTKTVKSAAIDILRRNNKNKHLPQTSDPCDTEDVAADAATQDIYAQVLRFIKTLPPQYIDPLTLYIVLGLSTNEIAIALRRPVNTVRTQIKRGQHMLRKEFSEVLKL